MFVYQSVKIQFTLIKLLKVRISTYLFNHKIDHLHCNCDDPPLPWTTCLCWVKDSLPRVSVQHKAFKRWFALIAILEKCKSNLEWDIISHQSEWLSLKSLQVTNARGCGEKGTSLHYWWEYKLVQPSWKTLWRFLRKRYAISRNPAPGYTQTKW